MTWIRAGWSAFGLALAILAALELVYIGQRTVRNTFLGTDDELDIRAPGHPYQQEAWYPTFLRARDAMRQRFDPLRTYSTYPVVSEFLNVDVSGTRATVQPAGVDGPTVLMLGGSTMWGYTNRDSQTIPSLFAATLRASGVLGVRVVNLAQPGYVLGQEFVSLQYALERGSRPVRVILLDGLNDILTTLMYGDPGHVFLQPRFQHVFEVQSRRGVFGAALGLAEQSALLQRASLWLKPPPVDVPPPNPGTCGRLGTHVERIYTSLLGLARVWDFDVLMAQQPMPATTGKTLTAFEARLLQPERSTSFIRECAAAIDSVMAPHRGSGYLSLAAAFDAWPQTVFIDRFGHLTEEAGRHLAGRLADATVSGLRRRLPASDGERRATAGAGGFANSHPAPRFRAGTIPP